MPKFKTTIAAHNGNTCVTYHSTVIVEFDFENIILRTGGWDTVTTRRKMNQASRQFDLGYNVFRHDGETFVRRPDGGDMPFYGEVLQFPRKVK